MAQRQATGPSPGHNGGEGSRRPTKPWHTFPRAQRRGRSRALPLPKIPVIPAQRPSPGGNSAESDYIMTDDDNFEANRAEDRL